MTGSPFVNKATILVGKVMIHSAVDTQDTQVSWTMLLVLTSHRLKMYLFITIQKKCTLLMGACEITEHMARDVQDRNPHMGVCDLVYLPVKKHIFCLSLPTMAARARPVHRTPHDVPRTTSAFATPRTRRRRRPAWVRTPRGSSTPCKSESALDVRPRP